jgi:hypothetical protein
VPWLGAKTEIEVNQSTDTQGKEHERNEDPTDETVNGCVVADLLRGCVPKGDIEVDSFHIGAQD